MSILPSPDDDHQSSELLMPKNLNAVMTRQNYRRLKIIGALCLACSVLILLFYLIVEAPEKLSLPHKISPECYHWNRSYDGTGQFLSDVLHHAKQPTLGKSIFFHETFCRTDQRINLNARQACAIESAAKMNPDHDVFVLFAAPVSLEGASAVVKALLKYPNIHLRLVDIWKYAEGTPIEEWFQDDILFTSDFPMFHLSDFMRYTSLYKYGGIYLDMDVIVQKNFSSIESHNFAGAESDEDVAAGIIAMDQSHVGRMVAEMCLRDFKVHFTGSLWGNNGPGVITRVMQQMCQTEDTTVMHNGRCRGFTVLPVTQCYAIDYKHWERFFRANETAKILELTKDSIIVHFWNKLSMHRRVIVGDSSTYDVLAKRNCPLVYAATGKYF